MALADFVILPISGAADEVVRVNKSNIIEARVINGGKTETQNENWYIQVTVLMGSRYLLVGTYTQTDDETPVDIFPPYATKELALAARDAFLGTF